MSVSGLPASLTSIPSSVAVVAGWSATAWRATGAAVVDGADVAVGVRAAAGETVESGES